MVTLPASGFFMHLTEFTEYLKLEKNFSDHTVSAYKRDLDQFHEFLTTASGTSLQDVEYNEVRLWMSHLLGEGISSRTVNRKLSSLKSYYRFLLKVDAISTDPMALHSSLKTDKKVQLPFSREEVFSILDAEYDKSDFTAVRDRLVIELLYSTGMRRDELINLRLVDVDIEEGILTVTGKRNKQRIIPLLDSLNQVIASYLSIRKDVIKDETEFLVVSDKGRKTYPSLVYRIIKSYFSTISSKVKVSPHILRHTFATHLLDAGADLNAVKELLGHASLASTQIYTHMSVQALKNVHANAHPRSKSN